MKRIEGSGRWAKPAAQVYAAADRRVRLLLLVVALVVLAGLLTGAWQLTSQASGLPWFVRSSAGAHAIGTTTSAIHPEDGCATCGTPLPSPTSRPKPTSTPTPRPTAPPAVTVYVQLIDSCRQAIPRGGSFALVAATDPHTQYISGPSGTGKLTAVSRGGGCPIPRGSCVATQNVGCFTFALPLPSSVMESYTLTERVAPDGYVPCESATTCAAPAQVKLTISASGVVVGVLYNAPAGRKASTYPISGPGYAGTQADPLVFYNYGT